MPTSVGGAGNTKRPQEVVTPRQETVNPQVMKKSLYPLMERPKAAFILALSAGLLNAWSFANTHAFATAQSGNVVMIGYRLMQNDWIQFWYVTGAVFFFGLGILVSTAIISVITDRNGRYQPALQGLIVTVLSVALFIAWAGAFEPQYITWLIAFVGGVQAKGYNKLEGISYGNAGMTQGVQLGFSYLAQYLFSKKAETRAVDLRYSGLHFLVVLAFASGGALGFALDTAWAGLSIALAIALSLGLMIAGLLDRSRPDSSPATNASVSR